VRDLPLTIHGRFWLSDLDERPVAHADKVKLACRLKSIDCLSDPRSWDKVAEKRFDFLLVGGNHAVQIFGK